MIYDSYIGHFISYGASSATGLLQYVIYCMGYFFMNKYGANLRDTNEDEG